VHCDRPFPIPGRAPVGAARWDPGLRQVGGRPNRAALDCCFRPSGKKGKSTGALLRHSPFKT